MTGNLDDGTAGLWAIKKRGGTAIVQDPREALYPSMPQNALSHVDVDHCLPIAEIGPVLERLTREAAEKKGEPRSMEMEIEVKIAAEKNAVAAGVQELGQPSSYACPECHGVLLKVDEMGRSRFRCHTGHAYSFESLLADSTEATERMLWSANRALEENALLLQEAAWRMRNDKRENHADLALQRAEEAKHRAELVRLVVSSLEKPAAEIAQNQPAAPL